MALFGRKRAGAIPRGLRCQVSSDRGNLPIGAAGIDESRASGASEVVGVSVEARPEYPVTLGDKALGKIGTDPRAASHGR